MVYTDLHYFGCLSFYAQLAQSDHVIFDLNAAYSKMSFKNRMVIATANGPLHLSIPIVGGRGQKAPMSEIGIANDTPWQKQHFKSIFTNYKRAPYFEYYADSLAILYQEKHVLLIEFLLATQQWTKQHLKAKWQIESKDTYSSELSQSKWVDPFRPNNFQDQVNPASYQQVFQAKNGFIPNLCVLDLLFAMGGKQSLSML